MIIAIVGMCGSGKSEVADYFREQGLEGVYFGEFTMERIRAQGLEITPENEKKAREEIRSQYGMGGFAKLALEKISSLLPRKEGGGSSGAIFIDGLYSTEEYEILHEHFPGLVVLLEVYADKEIRHRRLGKRPHRPLNPKQCRERDWAEIKNLNKGGPIALSDYKIENNGDKQGLHRNIDLVIKKIIVP